LVRSHIDFIVYAVAELRSACAGAPHTTSLEATVKMIASLSLMIELDSFNETSGAPGYRPSSPDSRIILFLEERIKMETIRTFVEHITWALLSEMRGHFAQLMIGDTRPDFLP
jgi:hypothetical protein